MDRLFTPPPLQKNAREYMKALRDGDGDDKMAQILAEIQKDLRAYRNGPKIDAVQELVFVNVNGYDTVWADFNILDVMSFDNFSAKRISYTAAEINWNPSSEVCLMATNRIAKDLTDKNPLYASVVLSSIPSYLTQPTAMHIANDVISLMSSSKPYIRQKAICNFYQICKLYPEALKAGFGSLRAALDSTDHGVIFASLSVLHILCIHSCSLFVQLIPKLHKMLENAPSWQQLRIIQILRLLCSVEPRLPKKLIEPFMLVLDNATSPNVLFEVVKAILEIPIKKQPLLQLATSRLEKFVHHSDANLRFLSLGLFLKLLAFQPNLIPAYRETVVESLDNDDEAVRVMALDMLSSLADSKSIDSIADRLFANIITARSLSTKNMLAFRLISLCQSDDYKLVTDFDWYISLVCDVATHGKISNFELIADALNDLAIRVPSTRERLSKEMGIILENMSLSNADPLLLTAAHVLGEFSDFENGFCKVLQPVIINFSPRVQGACIGSALRLYLRAEEGDRTKMEKAFALKLPMFEVSPHQDVQERAATLSALVAILGSEGSAMEELAELIGDDDVVDDADIEVPTDELELPTPVLDEIEEDDVPSPTEEEKAEKKEKRRKKRSEKPVTGPEKGCKAQLIGKNNSMSVRAIGFDAHPEGKIDVAFKIENLTEVEIEKVDIDFTKSDIFTEIRYNPSDEPIKPKGSMIQKVSLTLVDTHKPAILKAIFIPRSPSAEPIEGRLRVLPSLFLAPGPEGGMQKARQDCKHKRTLDIEYAGRPRDVLQACANVLSARVLPAGAPRSRALYSVSADGVNIVSIVTVGDIASVELETSDEALVEPLLKEVEARIKRLK